MELMKWKIGLAAYCCLILWVSSLAPKELPEQAFAVPDYVLHRLNMLCWEFLPGRLLAAVAVVSHGACLPFVFVLASQTNAGTTGGPRRSP